MLSFTFVLGYSREYKDILEAVRSRFDTRIEEILKLEDVEDQLYEFEILILIGEKLPEKLLQFIDERTKVRDNVFKLRHALIDIFILLILKGYNLCTETRFR